jgi:hypothetical protein
MISDGSVVKVAATVFAPFIVIVAGLAFPVKAPLQPLNTQPASGLAVKVTTMPEAYEG